MLCRGPAFVISTGVSCLDSSFSLNWRSFWKYTVADLCVVNSFEKMWSCFILLSSEPICLIAAKSVGQLRRAGMESMCMFFGHTGQDLSFSNILPKSLFIPETVLDLNLNNNAFSFLLKSWLVRYGWISKFSYFMFLTLLWDSCYSVKYLKAASFTFILMWFLYCWVPIAAMWVLVKWTSRVSKSVETISQKSPDLLSDFWASYICLVTSSGPFFRMCCW